ncbi:MAG TPA: DUF4350 domain-containing protein [Candidatus Angelobacter sp.]|jgi:hypothetical protein|nr:DUF4350 domain-containing protein [Candidatus Angelobacter sp.]
MPIKLEKSDLRLLSWAGAIVLFLIVVLVFISPQDEESSVPSSYSPVSGGAKAAYLLLESEGYKIQHWERSPVDLPVNPSNTVLIMALPLTPATKVEKSALELFLSEGGKIIATGATVQFYLSKVEIDLEPFPSLAPKEYQPEAPSLLTSGGSIKMTPSGYWKSASAKYMVHYSDEGKPVVVSYKVGKGEMIWWASSRPLTNIGIREAGNLGLLLGSLGVSKDVTLLWDEYFHGYQRSYASYLTDPPLLSGLIQLTLLFLAVLFTFARRNGPIHPLYVRSRLSPLEFVQTLGGLYQRASAIETAIEVPYARFRSQLAKRLGMKADARSSDLARAARERLGYEDKDLEKTLQEIESCLHSHDLSDTKALDLTQRLNRHTRSMKLFSDQEQENISNADRLTGTQPRTH